MNLFYNNTSPENDLLEFEQITKILLNDNHNHFISDWDSDGSLVYLKELYNKAYNLSIEHIDKYNSSEMNECQDVICNYINRIYGISLSHNQVIIGNSASSMISFYLTFLLSKNIKNFLCFTPLYYSFIDTLEIQNTNIILYQMNLSYPFFDIKEVENIIQNYNIQCVILTNPIFCFGIDLDMQIINTLSKLLNKYNCVLVMDCTREGLHWNVENEKTIIGHSITICNEVKNYVLIYSPCKNVFANGIKTGMMILPYKEAMNIFPIQDTFIGSISSIQIKFLLELFLEINAEYISTRITENKKYIISNFQKLSSMLLNTPIKLIAPNSGVYSVAKIMKGQMNDKDLFYKILKNNNTITLPMSLYNYFDTDYYLFRINLSLNAKKLIYFVEELTELKKEF